MRDRIRFTLSMLMWAVALFAAYAVSAHAQTRANNNQRVQPAGASSPVAGSGTVGQITRWTSASTIGDSAITETKYGQVGIGTTAPSSRLTVAGVIESTAGGVKFPDGTVQTTALSQASSPALQPFQQAISGTFAQGVAFVKATLGVPAGKRLVIETASLFVILPAGQSVVGFNLSTMVGGQLVDFNLFPNPVPSNGPNVSAYGMTQPLKIYADPGSQITASLARSDTSGGAGTGFSLAISGYLVDAQ